MGNPVADKIRIPDALWEGLKRVGMRRADVVRQARIPIASIRDGTPISTAQFFALWRVVVDISQDAAIGIRIAAGLEGAVMPASFLAAYHARDFGDALQRVSRFKRLCAPEEVHIKEQKSRCDIGVTWTHADGQATPSALIDATLVSIMELGRRGKGARLIPLAVELARPESAKAAYERYYGCRVRFGARTNRLSLDRADLNKPFVSYNAELLDILIPALDQRLEQQSHALTLAEQIRWVLRRRLTAGRPDIRSVASELAMSERSLQRKLTDEGLTFQGMLSDVRHQLALEYLAESKLTIMEVAYSLGYEDQNSLFRAFRQWENVTPTEWREKQGSQSQGSG